MEKGEVLQTIKQLKAYDQAITEPSEGLLFSEQDPSLAFFISVYLKTPYLHNLSSPVDVPLLKPILSFSKEQLPFSSLQMLLLVQDDQYELYTQQLKDSEFIGKLTVMKLSDIMLELGTKYLKGNTFENTRYNRFNEKKHFLNQYDLLFCDATLSRRVSSLFNSYKKRKQGVRPVTVDNVVDWIKNDLTHSRSFVVQGNSHFTVRIARTEWEDKDIFSNISHFLENKSNNTEVKNAFAQLAQTDIRMVMLHTNRSVYVKIYENVDVDQEKVKTFKAEKKWKNKGVAVVEEKKPEVVAPPTTPKKNTAAASSSTTPKKTTEATPKKAETSQAAVTKKAEPTPKKQPAKEEKKAEAPTTPKKNAASSTTPKKTEQTPKKTEATPKKVVEEASGATNTPRRNSTSALKAKLGSAQKK